MNETQYITYSQLVKDRKWTAGLVNKYLPSPCLIKRNPFYRKASPMKLYKVERVISIEQSKEFKEAVERLKNSRAINSQKAKQRAEVARLKILNYIQNLPISIPIFSQKKLYSLACTHYNDLWLERGEYEKHADCNSDMKFLNRISVNYLRHHETDYEEEIFKMFKKTGRQEAYEQLKLKILEKIAATYDFLKEEVINQKIELYKIKDFIE